AWYGNRITDFPANAFPNATACNDMFYGGIVFTNFAARNFNSMQTGGRFLSGSSRIPTSDYSELLVSLAANNTKHNVTFSAAASKYNSSAVAARNTLLARGWTITDGGLE